MPEDPQLDPRYDYAKLPDGSYAKFQKGTNPIVMQAKLAQAGLINGKPYAGPVKETKPDYQLPPYLGFTPSNVGKNLYGGAKSVVKGAYDIGKDLATNPNWLKDTSHDPTQRPSTAQKFVYAPADEQMRKAKEDYNSHRLLQSAGHFIAAGIPFLGPAAAGVGEQAGTGDVGGAASQAVGILAAGKAMSKTFDVAKTFVDPTLLKQRAANLDTKVLKSAKEGALNKTDVGLQVANEHIVSTLKGLPAKIEQVRAAKNAKVEALAKYHDAKGNTVDAEQGLAQPLRIIAQRLNTQGLLTKGTMEVVRTELNKLQNKIDLRTGKTVPRDLKHLTVRDAIELTKGLGKEINWSAEVKAVIEPFRKTIRQVINDAIDKVDPEITKARAEESRLIEARDAADKQFTAMKNDKLATATGIFRSGAPAIATWLGLRALGLMTPVTALGSVIVIKTLAESTLSRTARAALYAKAADVLERTIGQGQAPPNAATAPGIPQVGKGPSLPPNVPQQPANAATPPSIASPATAAPSGGLGPMPQAGPEIVKLRQLTLSESATRARAGSGDYVKKSEPTAPTRSVAKSNITSPAPTRNKAMLDRLDTLLERQAKPKSAMDNAAIQREIKEIKHILSGEATPEQADAINKRIADRERLAGKRSVAAASVPVSQTGAGGEAVSQHASPELRAIALDAGYKALAKYEGGDNMVTALRATAKAMQKLDPSYDEVEKLTEALQILRSLPKED